jgi:molybdopterin-guanine dinucleotide biosynthesis protein B
VRVAGFAGYSGAGKTTLIERLIPLLRQRGLRVSVVKHAHHRFDLDQPGKDSWRHREAGAHEVLLASDMRLALLQDYEQPRAPDVHALLARLDARVDWVLLEGFKEAALPKIEIWRPSAAGEQARPLLYPHDPCVVAVATDVPHQLPVPPRPPVLDLNAPAPLAEWLLAHAARFDYAEPREERTVP